MKTKSEPPPELAPHEAVTIQQEPLLELPPQPPLDPPPDLQEKPKPVEPFLRRG
jgi:hypothetical protein